MVLSTSLFWINLKQLSRERQRKRIMDMKAQDDFIDYSKLDKLIIGVCGGDGIGPMITGMRPQHALERSARQTR